MGEGWRLLARTGIHCAAAHEDSVRGSGDGTAVCGASEWRHY
jgi:hypothetical protein